MSNFIGKTLSRIVGQKAKDVTGQQYLTQQQDAQLTLAHLRKMFYEYLHPRNDVLTQTEKDDKLYSILPLFIKVIFFFFFV
jgi:hypothetical protein